jgi:hypothetical protein
MKKMILLFVVVIALSSCKKAVQTFTILGKWQVDSYTENGIDKTSAWKAIWQDYSIDFDISKDYVEKATVGGIPYTNTGTYEMTNSGNDIELVSDADSTVRYFHIIEIKINSAKYSEDAGTKVYHLSKI